MEFLDITNGAIEFLVKEGDFKKAADDFAAMLFEKTAEIAKDGNLNAKYMGGNTEKCATLADALDSNMDSFYNYKWGYIVAGANGQDLNYLIDVQITIGEVDCLIGIYSNNLN